MIFSSTSRSFAMKDWAISLIEPGVLRTALAVFRTITGIAMMQTTKTLAVSPMP